MSDERRVVSLLSERVLCAFCVLTLVRPYFCSDTSQSHNYKMLRFFCVCLTTSSIHLSLVSSAIDRGTYDDHGAMSVTSRVHCGPEGLTFEVGTPSPPVTQIS